MPTERDSQHPAAPTTLTRALLERARGETARAQLWTLSVASQRLRERLDTCDRQLRGLMAAVGTDRLVSSDRPEATPAEAIEAFAAIDDALRHLEAALRH